MIWIFILKCIYFMLPAYLANMAPVFAGNRFRWMAKPVDFNLRLFGKPLLGKNKTFRGLFFGVAVGLLTAYVQHALYPYSFFQAISFADYSGWIALGLALSFGALFGDMAESMLKRQFGIKPGKSFFPFDQSDFVIGALVLAYLAYPVTWQMWAVIVPASIVLHVVVNAVGYLLGMREKAV